MSEVLVIGAGALGLATAEALLQKGVSVTVLERGEVGREASWAGGGILSPLCPWDYPDEVTRLALRGAARFGDWAQALHQATGIDPEFVQSGMRVLPPFAAQAARQWCAAHGVACLPSPDGAEDEALFLPAVAQVRNPRLLQALRARVAQLGGRIVEQCEVKHVVAESGRVKHLATSQGELSAGTFIVTAGAWSKVLLGGHALQAAIKPIRGQMLLFKFPAPPLPHVLLQGDLYFIPRRDGHRPRVCAKRHAGVAAVRCAGRAAVVCGAWGGLSSFARREG